MVLVFPLPASEADMTSSNGVVVTSSIVCNGHTKRWTAEIDDDDDVDYSPRRYVIHYYLRAVGRKVL